jgi:hypothetical protein
MRHPHQDYRANKRYAPQAVAVKLARRPTRSPSLLWIAVPVAGTCPTAAIAGSVLGMAHDLREHTSATCTPCGKTC